MRGLNGLTVSLANIGRGEVSACWLLLILICAGQVNTSALLCGQTANLRGNTAFTEPFRSVDLSASETGRIASMNVRRGSCVEQGELLCELDVSSLLARRTIAEQRSKSTARRDALEVDYRRLQRRFEALQAISRDGGGSPEELANAKAEAQVAKFNMQAADEELTLAELEIAEIEARIEQRRVRATFDGIVTEVHRETGEFVSAADPKVITLVDLSRLRASFFLTTDAVADLQQGQATKLRVLASGRETTCTIEYIGPLTQAESGRVRVDVVFDNSRAKIRSGLQCVLPDLTPPAQSEGLTSRVPARSKNSDHPKRFDLGKPVDAQSPRWIATPVAR